MRAVVTNHGLDQEDYNESLFSLNRINRNIDSTNVTPSDSYNQLSKPSFYPINLVLPIVKTFESSD